MFKRKERSVFFSYFWSSMSLVLVFCVVLAFINIYNANISRQALADSFMQDLVKSADTFNLRLEEMRNIAYAVSNDDDMSTFSSAHKLGVNEYAMTYRLTQKVANHHQSNNMIDEVYLWFPNSSSALIGQEVISPALIPYSERMLKIDGAGYSSYFNKTLTESGISQLESVKIEKAGTTTQKLVYAINLWRLSMGKTHAKAFFTLNSELTDNLLSSVNDDPAGAIQILNGTEIVYSNGAHINPDEYPEDHDYGYTSVQRNGSVFCTYRPVGSEYTYIMKVSADYFYKRIYMAQSTSMFIAILMALLAAGMALLLTYKNVIPVRKLAVLAHKPDAKNEFAAISDTISQLTHDRERLEESVHRQRTLLRNAIFAKLLSYGFNSEDELEHELARVDISPEGDAFAVAYIHFSEMDDSDSLSTQVLISGVLNNNVTGIIHVQQLSSNYCAVFCKISPEGLTKLKAELDNILDVMISKHRISIWCSIGNCVKAMFDLPESYQSAHRLFICTKWDVRERVALTGNLAAPAENYWQLKEDVKCRLFNLCQTGEMSEISLLIEQVFYTDDDIKEPSSLQLKQLAYDFRGLFMRIDSELFDQPLLLLLPSFNRLPNSLNDRQLYQEVLLIFQYICSQVSERRQTRSYHLAEAIRQYICEMYADQSLSLASIAEHFNLNEKYISRLYKDMNGNTISSDIESIRFAHVENMMKDQSVLLTDICTACGYNNMNSFYKAFKRVYGVSPSAYRKSAQDKG